MLNPMLPVDGEDTLLWVGDHKGIIHRPSLAVMAREGVLWWCPNHFHEVLVEWASYRAKLARFDFLGLNLVLFMLVSRACSEWSYISKWGFLDGIYLGSPYARIMWWIKAWWKECTYSFSEFSTNLEELRVTKTMVWVRSKTWYAPPEGILKFNVDGSSFWNPGKSGIRGVIRNSLRRKLGLFCIPVGELWVLETEVKAILHARLFCQQFQFHHVFIESDLALNCVGVSHI